MVGGADLHHLVKLNIFYTFQHLITANLSEYVYIRGRGTFTPKYIYIRFFHAPNNPRAVKGMN